MSDSGVSAKSGILSGNQRKIIALVAMTCDHVGKELLPEYEFLQIIGAFVSDCVFCAGIVENTRSGGHVGTFVYGTGRHTMVCPVCSTVVGIVQRKKGNC